MSFRSGSEAKTEKPKLSVRNILEQFLAFFENTEEPNKKTIVSNLYSFICENIAPDRSESRDTQCFFEAFTQEFENASLESDKITLINDAAGLFEKIYEVGETFRRVLEEFLLKDEKGLTDDLKSQLRFISLKLKGIQIVINLFTDQIKENDPVLSSSKPKSTSSFFKPQGGVPPTTPASFPLSSRVPWGVSSKTYPSLASMLDGNESDSDSDSDSEDDFPVIYSPSFRGS